LPIKRVRGNQKAVQEFARAFAERTHDTPNLHVGIAHAEAPEREEAVRALVADLVRRRRSTSRPRSAPS
jgi:Uncharacterized protein conserved in bacteria